MYVHRGVLIKLMYQLVGRMFQTVEEDIINLQQPELHLQFLMVRINGFGRDFIHGNDLIANPVLG